MPDGERNVAPGGNCSGLMRRGRRGRAKVGPVLPLIRSWAFAGVTGETGKRINVRVAQGFRRNDLAGVTRETGKRFNAQ